MQLAEWKWICFVYGRGCPGVQSVWSVHAKWGHHVSHESFPLCCDCPSLRSPWLDSSARRPTFLPLHVHDVCSFRYTADYICLHYVLHSWYCHSFALSQTVGEEKRWGEIITKHVLKLDYRKSNYLFNWSYFKRWIFPSKSPQSKSHSEFVWLLKPLQGHRVVAHLIDRWLNASTEQSHLNSCI